MYRDIKLERRLKIAAEDETTVKTNVKRTRILLLGMGLILIGIGRSHGEIVVEPGTLYESRLGYLIDGANSQINQVYNLNNVIAGTPLLTIPTAQTGSFSDSDVTVSVTNHGTALGTNFELSSTASAAILSPAVSFAYAHAYSEYLAFFHVTATETFHATASLTANASLNGPVSSFEFLSLAYIIDTVTGQMLYDNIFVYTYGHGSLFGIPADLSLVANHPYLLLGETFASAAVRGSSGLLLGSVWGSAEVQFNLSSVPEPASLPVFALGGLALLGQACRRRRSAV